MTKKVYSFTIDATPSNFVYTTKDKAIFAARRAFTKYKKEWNFMSNRNFDTELAKNPYESEAKLVYIDEYPVK